MLRSLVGSEMCIRDSFTTIASATTIPTRDPTEDPLIDFNRTQPTTNVFMINSTTDSMTIPNIDPREDPLINFKGIQPNNSSYMIREHQPPKLNLTQQWNQCNQEQCSHSHSANAITCNNNATQERPTYSQYSIVNEFDAYYARTRKNQEQQQLKQGKARGKDKHNTYHQEQQAKREQTIKELTELNKYHQQKATQQQTTTVSTTSSGTQGNDYSQAIEANNQAAIDLSLIHI